MAIPDKWVGQFFKADEFACSCNQCGRWEVHTDLIEIADLVRGKLGVSLQVNSGVRCGPPNDRNKAVGGRSNSLHLPSGATHVGHAADFTFSNPTFRSNPLNILRLYVLFESFSRRLDYGVGLGLYGGGFVHFDVRGALGFKAARWDQGFPWVRL